MLFSLPTLIVFLSFRNEVKITGSQTSASLQETIKIVNHSLTSFKELKVIGCENYFQAQIKEETKKYAKCGVNSQSYIMLPKIFLETSMIVSIISFIILSQFFVENTQIGITSVLAVFSIGAVRLIPTLNGCFSSLNQINHSAHAVDMIFSDLKEENQIRSLHQKYPNKNQKADCVDHSFLQENTCGVDYTHEIACLEFKDKIELTNVFYQYPSTLEPSINGVSLSIVKGQSIAFIGKSGAGKTTLVDILLGLLNLESGDIRVDNKSIYSNIRLWQNIIGYIPQSICLLDDTIQKNIAFGVDDKLIDKDKLLRSVKLAQLEKLIQELPDGLFTKVGERGILLSGGQRQRIGIARALYHQREILVMDEATSALDNETEKLVNESIKSLSGQLTIVIIAHRLSTVEHCDKVYLLEKGCVVDSGTYEEIISRNKIK
jgi:ABC-type branched-subunit amino acid transport system ATPase component